MSNLIGAGGGGGGKGGKQQKAYTPSEAPDSLDSRQYATLVDLIGEGEIQGLVNGHRSIYLENTPLQNADGTYNYKNVTLEVRNGTQDQSAIPFASDAESEVPVGVTIDQATPTTRTITDRTVDAVRVTITIPTLQAISDKGDVLGSAVHLQVLVQYNGGGFTVAINDIISGRTADAYQRDYLINLNPALSFPVDIRVIRINPDSTSAKVTNAFNWTSYTEITRAKLRYPNSALIAWRIDAEQFSSIPSRSYHVRGRKIRIPSNGTVNQTHGNITYAGIWNGTFAAATWTSDPAWCLWDMLTGTRHGLGDHILTASERASFTGNASRLDKWAFYAASKYCAELVDDGYGGKEPRFSCNVLTQTPQEAYKAINDMCAVFRAMPFWSAGSLTISQDAPSDPVYLFTNANVVDGVFEYSSSSLKNRPTVVNVAYYDMQLRDTAYEAVEDQERIASYGVVMREMDGFACTSRGQARRIGEWLLYSEWNEGEVVAFSVGIESGVVVRPGQVVAISDSLRAGSRRSGRISAATTTAITVDDATGLEFVSGATLSVILPTGIAETRAVSSMASGVFTLAAPFTVAPNANSIWIYDTPALQSSTWRVLGIQEQDGINYAVSAISYNASKYASIEQGLQLQQRQTSPFNALPVPPTNPTAEEVLYADTGIARSKIIVHWTPVVGITQYRVLWRYEDDNWTTATTNSPDYEILDSRPGSYQVKIYSINAALRSSTEAAEIPLFTAAGKTAPPQAVSGISLVPIDEASAIISWERSQELDVTLGGKVLIRHNSASTGALWEDSQEIVAAAAGSQTQKQVPLLSGTYLLKFEDDGGRRSTTAATASIQLPTPQPRLLVQSYREDQETPPFSGNVVDMVYSSELDGLILATGIPIDSLAADGDFDALGVIDNTSGSAGIGEYEFGSTFDLGGVYDLNLRRHFVTRPYTPGELIDDALADIDSWPSIDGTLYDNVNAALYVRATDDNPGASPTWTPWTEFANVIIRGRAFQFKAIATSTNEDQNIIIDELGCELELQQRAASAGPLTTSAAAYAVTFAQPFYQPPQLAITGYNMATGDYYVISSPTRLGFTITFYNAANSMIARQFSYTAIGYGREVI